MAIRLRALSAFVMSEGPYCGACTEIYIFPSLSKLYVIDAKRYCSHWIIYLSYLTKLYDVPLCKTVAPPVYQGSVPLYSSTL